MAKSENAEVRGLQLALETGKYHDFTITCCAREWKVHRVILCSQSKYFEIACEENKFKEGASRTIGLEEDDADMVDHMLRFLYTSDYPANADSSQPLLVNAKVYALADKYQITALKDLAKDKFEAALSSGWDIIGFPEVIGMVYTTTLASDRALRDCLAPFLVKHKEDLRENEAFMGLVRGRLADGEFAVDVIDAWSGLKASDAAGIHLLSGPFQCRHCNSKWHNCPWCEITL